MGKSWELTEDQKKEIQEQQAEIGAQYADRKSVV